MAPTFSPKSAVILCAIVLVTSIPALWAWDVGNGMVTLLSQVDPERAYFRVIEPGLQYGLMPLVLLGTLVLVMAPGLLLVAAAGRATDLYRWILEAFLVSLGTLGISTAIIQGLSGQPLVGRPFAVVTIMLALVGAAVLLVRARRGRLPWLRVTGPVRLELLGLVAIPVLYAVVLTPKFFWEAFNGDGAHAFESARLLLFQAWPFWSENAGAIGTWPGVNGLMLPYPLSWFLRLFGMTEAGVRLPFVLFLPLLYAGLRLVIATGRTSVLGGLESGFVWAAVVGYALVMCYSATYNPYSADIAMPATHDTLVMILFLGAAGAWMRGERVLLVVWSLLALLTSPAALVMLSAAVVGILVSERPWRWRVAMVHGVGLVVLTAGLVVLPIMLSLFGIPTPGSEHSSGLLAKFAFLALGDLDRFLFAFLPVGVYPVIGVLAWRGADEATRVLSVVTGLVFGMYYVIGASSLHYFVPAMLLPVAAFWRRFPADRLAPGTLAMCGAAALLAIWLAMPVGSGIYTATRDVGSRIDARAFASYHDMDHAAIAASDRLGSLLPADGAVGVPDARYGDSPLAWHYYAQRPEYSDGPKDYLMQRPGAQQPPDGATLVGADARVAVYVLDELRWHADRSLHPTHSRGRAVYQIDRDVLFMRGAARERLGFFSPGIRILDLLGLKY